MAFSSTYEPPSNDTIRGVYNFFATTPLSTSSFSENPDRWDDTKVGEPKHYNRPRLDVQGLIPYYTAYANILSGAPLTTAPIAKILNVLILYLKNGEGEDIFQELHYGDKEVMNWNIKFQPVSTVIPGQSEFGVHEGAVSESREGPLTFVDQVTTWLADSEYSSDIKTLLSYHALVAFRASVKTAESTKRALDEKLMATFKSLYPHVQLNITFPNTPMNFIQNVKQNMEKGTPICTNLFKTILSVYVKAKNDQNKSTISCLEAGILRHTQGNGLGMISMLLGIASLYQMTVGAVAKYFVTNVTLTSWTRAREFASLYLATNSKCITWWWCRIVDDTQWTSLRISQNPILGIRLASVLQSHNIDIMKNYDLSQVNTQHKKRALQIAEAFHRMIQQDIEQEKGIEEAESLLTMTRQLNIKQSESNDMDEILSKYGEQY
ncbi:MAG: hypothetical protein [Apis rhabdovirus 4]|uniref:Nucleocapsid protein n=1 Tax=Apis rhabdovirus 4 TaxID=2873558 RepID=A0A8K1J8N8_9RHAB|nr:MAG: hypothetical protein [Apis rhabdovirus 4]